MSICLKCVCNPNGEEQTERDGAAFTRKRVMFAYEKEMESREEGRKGRRGGGEEGGEWRKSEGDGDIERKKGRINERKKERIDERKRERNKERQK